MKIGIANKPTQATHLSIGAPFIQKIIPKAFVNKNKQTRLVKIIDK
ncbi:hypothetical protein PDQ40_23530 [Bacillus cereus group sp. Bc061]|nr:hypothetical protein [Bacillus cereus group sp. Bc061]MDA2598622.1 hypothetical protein [Bacillus cereus group sp. Bc061]